MIVFVNGNEYKQDGVIFPASARDDGESRYLVLPLSVINPELLKAMEDAFSAENGIDIAECTGEEVGVVFFDDGKTALEISACDEPDNCLVCDREICLKRGERESLESKSWGADDVVYSVFEYLDMKLPIVGVADSSYFGKKPTITLYDKENNIVLLNHDYVANLALVAYGTMMAITGQGKDKASHKMRCHKAINYTDREFPGWATQDMKDFLMLCDCI